MAITKISPKHQITIPKEAFEKLRHPSLRLKKIKGHPTIWEGRITESYRFTFQIAGEIYLLRRIGTHDILKTP